MSAGLRSRLQRFASRRDAIHRAAGCPARHLRAVAIALSLTLFGLVVLRSAWLAEDAYITFRTADNWIHGWGLTWNAGERVQAYTHPLWLFAVAGARLLSGELFYTVVALSTALSLAAAAIIAAGVARSPQGSALALAILCASKSFVDYSTSGLENPLTHLLLAIGIWAAFDGGPRRLPKTAAAAGLAALNRLDTALLFLPLLLSAWRAPRRQGWPWILVAVAPIGLWTGFSLLYYGSPVPNTAYAKLHTGLPHWTLVSQGLGYLWNLATWDPVCGLVLVAGLAVAARAGGPARAAAGGAALYLAYVVWVGGDFMSGRFLTGPLLLAAAALTRQVERSRPAGIAAAAAVLLVGLANPRSPLTSGVEYGVGDEGEERIDGRGIADERAFYYEYAGLLRGRQDETLRTYRHALWGLHWRQQAAQLAASGSGERYVVEVDAIGYAGYYAGPHVHIINPLALSDPLLARLLPAVEGWRIGHFRRPLPEGYRDSLRTGRNLIADPHLRQAYDELRRITGGELFDGRRLRSIWTLNTGGYDGLFAGG